MKGYKNEDRNYKKNILLNIKLYVQTSFKTQEDMKDEWKKGTNKWQIKLVYFDKIYVTDFYMGSGLVDKRNKPKKPSEKYILYSMMLNDLSGLDFNDFCNEFSYNSDSIKVLKIYEACKRDTKAYYDMFDNEERAILKELLQDY